MTVESDLLAVEDVEDIGLFSQHTKGVRRAGLGTLSGIVLFDFRQQGFAFEIPDTEETPAGSCHGFDQPPLGFGFRIKLAGKIVKDIVKDFRYFFFEDDALGEEAVTEVVT